MLSTGSSFMSMILFLLYVFLTSLNMYTSEGVDERRLANIRYPDDHNGIFLVLCSVESFSSFKDIYHSRYDLHHRYNNVRYPYNHNVLLPVHMNMNTVAGLFHFNSFETSDSWKRYIFWKIYFGNIHKWTIDTFCFQYDWYA